MLHLWVVTAGAGAGYVIKGHVACGRVYDQAAGFAPVCCGVAAIIKARVCIVIGGSEAVDPLHEASAGNEAGGFLY